MAIVSKSQLKNWFRNGLKPVQDHFWNWMDSYWHKSEKIPTSSIENLESYFDSVAITLNSLSNYAQRDAQNLDADDVISWQEALEIGGSNDVDVKLTQSHDLFDLDENDTQSDYNKASEEVVSELIVDLSEKLETPSEVGDPDDCEFIVGLNEAGDSVKLLSDGLGKNIGNSDLKLLEPRILDTDGKPFSIEKLPDKSSDSTFTDFLGKSRTGQIARVGYQAFKQQVTDWTQSQRNEFSQLLNGGFSQGSISVNMISPPVFEQEDNDVYIVLRGANLNLHPTQRKIEILDADTENILAEIPVSQIQTYSSGTELFLYYNFNTIGTGVYKLRITSGVNVFVTTQNFQIVSSVTNIDLSSNTFDILTSYSNTLSFATNDTVLFENEIEGENSTVPIFSAKSSELFSQGEDFYLEVLVDNQNNITGSANTRIAIGYSNSTNQLVYTGLSYFGIYHAYINNQRKMIRVNTRTKNHGVSSESVVGSVIFIKQGNLLTTLFNDLITAETISNNSGYSLFFQAPNRVSKETTSIQIIKAYKF